MLPRRSAFLRIRSLVVPHQKPSVTDPFFFLRPHYHVRAKKSSLTFYLVALVNFPAFKILAAKLGMRLLNQPAGMLHAGTLAGHMAADEDGLFQAELCRIAHIPRTSIRKLPRQ